MKSAKFEEIWKRIIGHEGETFYTIRGLDFTYKIEGTGFYPSSTEYRIGKGDFEKAHGMLPIDGPGVIRDIVRGPTFVWAVLHDKRISKGEW